MVAATPGIARQVERIRGLRFDRLPRPRLISTEKLTERFRREAERTNAIEDLREAEILLKLVGLVEEDEDLSGLLDAVASDVAGAYDPRTGELYVIEDAIPDEQAVVEVTLAHELTHALEDQVFGLRDTEALSDDRSVAYQSLGEGTATAVMIQFAAERNLLGQLLLADPGTSDIGEVPAVIQAQLVFPYLAGQEFVQELRRAGGDWDLVNVAEREDPPVSSEQILHPEKFLAGEAPAEVRLPVQTLRRGDWRRIDRGDVGEFDLRQVVAIGADQATAQEAAAGWGGGRFALWRRQTAPVGCEAPCREHHAAILRIAFDTRPDATEFAAQLPAYLEGIGGEETSARDATGETRLPGGAAAYSTRGRLVTVAFAPTPSLARRLSDGP